MTLQDLLKKLEPASPQIHKTSAFINDDIAPLPPSRRTWSAWSFVGFWLIVSINISNYTIGSSLIGLGLNVGQSAAAIVIGNTIVGIATCLTGAPGSRWHIPFAVINRSTWGMYGSFFVLANRCILSFTWHACQSYFGARCVRVLIGSLAPSFYNLNASLAGGTLDSSTLISFVIFSILELPLLWLKPEYYKKPFFIFSCSISTLCVVMLIWAMARAGGGGALMHDASAVAGVTAVDGLDYVWAMVYANSTVLGSICAGMLNQSDYTRYARKTNDPVLAQLLSIPISRIFTGMVGIIVTSCAAQWWPEKGLLWMPQDLLTQVQMSEPTSGTRAAVFFAALIFTCSQLSMNASDNAIPSGIDLTSMFPKYLTIRRGAYLTAIISVLIQPWQLLNGSSIYLTVMGSYAVFIAPLTGTMVADYFLVRHRKLKLTELYNPTPASMYWFTMGLNWRAVVAWSCGVLPMLPGFIHYVQARGKLDGYNTGAIRLFQLSWPFGFAMSAVTFAVLSYFFKPVGLGGVDAEE